MEPSTIAAFTNPEILIGTFGYLLLKPALKNSGLVDTKKGAYKMSMIIYNVLMAVFSAACFVATTTALGWDRGYGASLLAWSGDTPAALYTDACPPPVFNSKLFMLAAKAFYYSKYFEYLDTAWLVPSNAPHSSPAGTLYSVLPSRSHLLTAGLINLTLHSGLDSTDDAPASTPSMSVDGVN